MDILILGASYGSLLATKCAMAGHRVTLVCTVPTADLINREGTLVRFPIRGRAGLLEVASRSLPGEIRACTPSQADPAGYALVVLGMQENQYGADDVLALMRRIAAARKPCVAIMNMPPLTYLHRLERLSSHGLRRSYAHAELWDEFDPALMTLASPDPQAFRPAQAPKNVLEVGLPTNFKVARFESDQATALLRELERDIDASRFLADGEAVDVPVRCKVYESVFVPLAKWPMLITGNYRCVQPQGAISIREAVWGDPETSRRIYQWVVELCLSLGANAEDLVPFEKYAKAAQDLGKPSSIARALTSGARHVERVDALIERIALQRGIHLPELHAIVMRVDDRLRRNRDETAQAVALAGG
jgi:hypothetical protein